MQEPLDTVKAGLSDIQERGGTTRERRDNKRGEGQQERGGTTREGRDKDTQQMGLSHSLIIVLRYLATLPSVSGIS